MKTFTNHTAGPRGINIEGGSTVWIEPGQSVEIDLKTVAGKVPDLGEPGEAPTSNPSEIERLTTLLGERDAEIADLNLKLAAFDRDGDGKPGGSKAAAKA